MLNYNPFDWYWLADDGRVFASARELIINTGDAQYQAWLAAGNVATAWPRDAAGNQTNAALQDVLTPYSIFVDLIAYAANARFNRASGGVTVTSISPIPFLSDSVSRNTVNSAWNYSAQQGANYSVQWKLSNGSFVALSKAQIATVANDMAAFVQNCFACESDTVNKINGGTITTAQQVDAAFAAISNVFP